MPFQRLPLAIIACLALSAEAKADYAVNLFSDDATFLMFAEEHAIVLATCDEGTGVYNRESCRSDLLSVDLGRFDAALLTEYGKDLEALEQSQRDAWVNLEQIDAR